MIQYYFHLSTMTEELIKDEEGSDFADLNAAKEEALMAARELIADAVHSGRELTTDAIINEDADGHELDRVRLLADLPRSFRG